MSETAEELTLLGDALQQAWRRDHERRHRPARHLRRRRRVALVALAVAVLGTGAAVAGSVLKSAADEEAGMLAGHVLFEGSDPTCERTSATSFRCTLARPPTGMTFYDEGMQPQLDRFVGVDVPTVDANRRVDGGCTSVSADGRLWDCYLGEAAVRHGVIGRGFLGTYLPEPPTG